MRREDFTSAAPGELVRTVDGQWAFVPAPLPTAPTLDLRVVSVLHDTTLAVGRLDQLGRSLTNPYILIRAFIRREAVASSRIEGTTAGLGQLLLFEASDERIEQTSDVREVANYVRALEMGLNRSNEWPLTLALIRALHRQLLQGVRGEDKRPGEFRDRQNWISGLGRSIREARFVPPPPQEVPRLMAQLEHFWRGENPLPALIRLALIHYQFETIHPFFDGNGRVGRLLLPLLLNDWGIMNHPLLYPSAVLELDRELYDDQLLRACQTGDWNTWLAFFLDVIQRSAEDATERGNQLLELREAYRNRYHSGGSARLLQLIDLLFESPTLTSAEVSERLGVAFTTAHRLINRLVEDGVLIEITGRQRDRTFAAREIIAVLERSPSTD